MRWRTVKLGDVADIIRGVSFDNSETLDYAAEGTLPILRAGNIQDEVDTLNDLVWVPMQRVSTEQLLKEGDILIAMSSGSIAIVGKTAQMEHDWNGSVGAFCAIVRPKESICPRFLHFYLRGPQFSSWRQSAGIGLNIKNIRRSELESFPIPLPPLEEQRRIVEILDEADRLRKLRRQADAIAERILPALFYKMFGDPVRNEKGWKRTTFDSVLLETQYGYTARADKDETGILYLRMNNVDFEGWLDLSELKYVKLRQDEFEKYRLVKGDIVFNRTNSAELVGKTALWDLDIDAVPASYLIRAKVDESKVAPEYCWAYMNSKFMKQLIANKARRAIGMANINAQELRSFPILIPPLDIQETFARKLVKLKELRTLRTNSVSKTDALFSVLLHRAFTGELTKRWREEEELKNQVVT